MPRPKRAKVAPSAPRIQKSTTSTIANTASKTSIAALEDPYDISDPEEELKSVRYMKKDRGKGRESAAKSVSQQNTPHAPTRDTEASHRNLPSIGGVTSHLVSGVEKEHAIGLDLDLDSSSPSIEVGRRERPTSRAGNSTLTFGNFRRRAREPSILGRGAGRARSSSVESNLADDNGLSSVGGRNTSALRAFKRRAREPSILGRGAAPSSIALEMDAGTPAQPGSVLKIGAFKRRAREPSILQTAQKPQQTRAKYDDDDDEEDFNPDDESTPLNLSRSRIATSSSNLALSNSRKRKLLTAQVHHSSPDLPSPPPVEAEDIIPATDPLTNEIDEDGQDDEDECLLPSVEARSVTPEPWSETMAPPRSSSLAALSPDLPLRARRAQSRVESRIGLRGRTPPPRTQDSPISSPPSLTHSPNRPTMITTKHKPKPAPLPASTFSTAQLQNLLPRRRRRPARDVFDIASSEDDFDVSGLAPDDDELSHLHVRARSRRQASVAARTPAPPKRPGKQKAAPKSTAKRMYGSRGPATSDKENDAENDEEGADGDVNESLGPLPDEDESPEESQELEKRVGKELKTAAKKFKEVDEWELEFEDVTASSSSPRNAR